MAEIMSEEGFKAILAEIQYLESVERPKASQAIAEARDKGDLSENAEYDAAKDAQGKLEARIALLKDKVANARIIDATKLSTEKIQIMSKVRLLNHKLKKEVTYTPPMTLEVLPLTEDRLGCPSLFFIMITLRSSMESFSKCFLV